MSTQSSDCEITLDDELDYPTVEQRMDELLENISKTRLNDSDNNYSELLDNYRKLSSDSELTTDFLLKINVKMQEYLEYINFTLSKAEFNTEFHDLLDELEYLVTVYYYTLNTETDTKFDIAKRFHSKLILFIETYCSD